MSVGLYLRTGCIYWPCWREAENGSEQYDCENSTDRADATLTEYTACDETLQKRNL